MKLYPVTLVALAFAGSYCPTAEGAVDIQCILETFEDPLPSCVKLKDPDSIVGTESICDDVSGFTEKVEDLVADAKKCFLEFKEKVVSCFDTDSELQNYDFGAYDKSDFDADELCENIAQACETECIAQTQAAIQAGISKAESASTATSTAISTSAGCAVALAGLVLLNDM